MKLEPLLIGAFIGLGLGGWLGYSLCGAANRTAVLSGPYSDNYDQALAAIDAARVKWIAGDADLLVELEEAHTQIEHARDWTERFLNR